MAKEEVTRVRLGEYLDECLDQALSVLQKRNPGLAWDKEQLVRLTVGYGLNRLFRQHPRRLVHLMGSYTQLYPEAEAQGMIVENLSSGGIGFRTVASNNIQANEIQQVAFFLDNDEGTMIQKMVMVKHVGGRTVGAAYIEPFSNGKYEAYLERPTT